MIGAIYTIWLRNMKRYLRSKSRIIGSLGQPLFFLLILGFGLNSLAIPGMGQNYLSFIVPGIIAITVMFTAIFSGIQIIWDKQFGFLKETLIAPISRNSIMLGQTLGGATTAIIQGLIVLVISVVIAGFTPTLPGFLIAVFFMCLIGLALTAFGIAIASRMEDMQGFQLIMNFVVFPIFLTSGAIFPLNTAPDALKLVAHLNPVTYGVEGIRYGLFGISMIDPLTCFVALGGFAIAMVLIGGYLFRKIKI